VPIRRKRAPKVVLPPPGTLRRERRALLQAREERLRDLGGLILEMYRRDRFREDLVHERCAELLELDRRLAEIDELLRAATRRAPLRHCACGAPLPPRSHFCPTCGRPAGDAPVVACASCGHALPADAVFCPQCGAPGVAVDAVEELPPPQAAAEET
jgi:predicted amidophosphoribosyltransferase